VPESAAGRAARSRTATDRLDVEKRRLALLVAEDVLLREERAEAAAAAARAWLLELYFDHVLQAARAPTRFPRARAVLRTAHNH